MNNIAWYKAKSDFGGRIASRFITIAQGFNWAIGAQITHVGRACPCGAAAIYKQLVKIQTAFAYFRDPDFPYRPFAFCPA